MNQKPVISQLFVINQKPVMIRLLLAICEAVHYSYWSFINI